MLGPSFKDVAAKYKDNKGAVDLLATKIVKGGSGVWGPVPMPANTQVSEADAKKLAAWVLSTQVAQPQTGGGLTAAGSVAAALEAVFQLPDVGGHACCPTGRTRDLKAVSSCSMRASRRACRSALRAMWAFSWASRKLRSSVKREASALSARSRWACISLVWRRVSSSTVLCR